MPVDFQQTRAADSSLRMAITVAGYVTVSYQLENVHFSITVTKAKLGCRWYRQQSRASIGNVNGAELSAALLNESTYPPQDPGYWPARDR